jgi:VWFA-related protein
MLRFPESPAGTMGRLFVVLALVACAIGMTVLAQEKPAADKPVDGQIGGLRFVDVSEVTIVNVKVSVSDKKGPVLGLTKDDFEVYQDGKLQELTNFALYSEPATVPTPPPAPATAAAPAPPGAPVPTPAPAPEALPAPEPLFITLYIDNENVLPLNRNRVLTRVTDFVHQYVKPPDRAMLVSYQRSLKVLQPYTSDPEEIIEALRQVKMYAGGRVSTMSSRKEIEEAITDETKTNNDMERLYSLIRGFAQEQQTNLKFTVGSLKEIVTMMSGLPGRKVLIYVSDGLPMNPGLELYYELQANYNDPGVLAHSQDLESSSLFRGLVTTAAAAGVTIHTIDCRGLDAELGIEAENRMARSTMSSAIAMSNYQDSLVYMAEQTGGLAVINTNDVSTGLRRIGLDMTTFYSLGYRLTPTGQDRVHRIQVKLKKDLGYRLSFRKTFIEKTLPTRVGDRVMSGLAFDLEDNPLGITLSAGEPSPSSGGRWLLPVEVRLPIDKIALVPDGDQLAGFLSVYYAARDNEGKQSDLQTSEHAVRILAADYGTAQSQMFVVRSSLLLEPGTYRISVGVRDQLTNQAGYAATRRPVHPEKV